MSRVYKCDICGAVEPRSIRHLCTSNPDVSNEPLNKEKYYAFNLINEDICDECLYELERKISSFIYDMRAEKKEYKNGKG